jgi:hypothetical protein
VFGISFLVHGIPEWSSEMTQDQIPAYHETELYQYQRYGIPDISEEAASVISFSLSWLLMVFPEAFRTLETCIKAGICQSSLPNLSSSFIGTKMDAKDTDITESTSGDTVVNALPDVEKDELTSSQDTDQPKPKTISSGESESKPAKIWGE